MKYPRNAKIFRGQLEAAPVACVFFVLLIMVLFHSSLVYTPGLPAELVQLNELRSSRSGKKELVIGADQSFIYENSKYKEQEFYQRLREQSRKGRAPKALLVHAPSSLDPEVMSRLEN